MICIQIERIKKWIFNFHEIPLSFAKKYQNSMRFPGFPEIFQERGVFHVFCLDPVLMCFV